MSIVGCMAHSSNFDEAVFEVMIHEIGSLHWCQSISILVILIGIWGSQLRKSYPASTRDFFDYGRWGKVCAGSSPSRILIWLHSSIKAPSIKVPRSVYQSTSSHHPQHPKSNPSTTPNAISFTAIRRHSPLSSIIHLQQHDYVNWLCAKFLNESKAFGVGNNSQYS